MRTKDQYLELRGKTYYYQRPVPKDCQIYFGKTKWAFTLQTRKLTQARDYRDEHSATLEREIKLCRDLAKAGAQKNKIEAGQRYFNLRHKLKQGVHVFGRPGGEVIAPEDQPLVAADEAYYHNVQEPLGEIRDRGIDPRTTAEGRRLLKLEASYHGEMSWVDAGEITLSGSNVGEATKKEYQRAYALADEHFLPCHVRVTKPELKAFINKIAPNYSEATIRKMLTGFRKVVHYFSSDPSPFLNIKEIQPGIATIKRQVWTPDEIQIMRGLTKGHWLHQVIKIALYTGRRESAIASLTYNPDEDSIYYPPMKHDFKDDRKDGSWRPCHPAIRADVEWWSENKRSSSSIGNQFRKLKQQMGIPSDNVKVFHSFRHNCVTALEELGYHSEIARRYVGHKPDSKNVTASVYGGKSDPGHMREMINALRYDTWL